MNAIDQIILEKKGIMDLIFENSRRRAREILQTFKNFKKTLVNKIDTNSAF